MAQVKITEYFTSCKKRYYDQPQKRRKTDDGHVNLNYDSVHNGKCIVNSASVKTKEIDTNNRVLIPSESAPNKRLAFFSSSALANSSSKKKGTGAFSKRKVRLCGKPNQIVLQGDSGIRRVFTGVRIKPNGFVETNRVPDISTRTSEISDITLDEVKFGYKGLVGYSTPEKKHISSSTVECSPPKRRKPNDSDIMRNNKTNDLVDNGKGQISVARRSLVMTDESLLTKMNETEEYQKNSEDIRTDMCKTSSETFLGDNVTSAEVMSGKKKLTRDQIKERLQKCGKLEGVKEMLLSLKKRTDKVKMKMTLSPQKSRLTEKISPRESPVKLHSIGVSTKECQTAPAYERYYSLAAKGAPSLTLPFKYRQLVDIFRCVDTIVSMLHNRQELCTFSKLKYSVQDMLKRAFKLCNLGQIKTVFPLAYFFHQEKCHPNTSTRNNKSESYQLTITPNLNYIASSDTENISELRTVLGRKVPQMDSSCLVERRTIFHTNLISIVKKHHQAFLESLNRPILISNDEIHRWHPKFPLDDVPDIEPSPLPKPPGTTYSTAQDVLEKVQSSLGHKVENALKNIAEKKANQPTQDDAGSSVETNNNNMVRTGALKGISQSLLEKIRAKEASHLAKEMMRKPEDDKRLEMIARLPELIRILRSYFVTEKKSTISVEQAKMKLSESYHSPLSPEEVEQHIILLSDLLPDWLSLITIRKGIFIKIDKKKEIASLLEKLENERK